MSRSNKKLLVVAAQPDDEVLGCGATVRLKVNKGWRVRLLLMTGGVTGRLVGDNIKLSAVEEEQAKLAAQVKKAAKVIGFEHISIFFAGQRCRYWKHYRSVERVTFSAFIRCDADLPRIN